MSHDEGDEPIAEALYDFEADADNELGFNAGDLLRVLDQSAGDWWLGRHVAGKNLNRGFFPSNRVEILDEATAAEAMKEVLADAAGGAGPADDAEGGPTAPFASPETAQSSATEATDGRTSTGGNGAPPAASLPRGNSAAAALAAAIEQVRSEDTAREEARAAALATVAAEAPEGAIVVCECVAAFEAEGDNEMPLSVGDIVETTSRAGDWWFGKIRGTRTSGYFPSTYVKVLEVNQDDDSGDEEAAKRALGVPLSEAPDAEAGSGASDGDATDSDEGDVRALLRRSAGTAGNDGGDSDSMSGYSEAPSDDDGEESEDNDKAPPDGKVPPSRAMPIHELLMTETSYVNDLEIFREVCVKPILDRDAEWKRRFMASNSVAVLFSNLESILEVNKTFYAALCEKLIPPSEAGDHDHAKLARVASERPDHGDHLASGGEAQRRHAASMPLAGTPPQPEPGVTIGPYLSSFSPYFELYGVYASYHDDAAAALDALRGDPTAAQFLDACQHDPRCKTKDFRSFLILPIQRVPRYRLLLQEMLKRTPRDHPDRRPLRTAVKRVDMAAHALNRAIRRREAREKLRQLESRFIGDIDLVVTGRQLLLEGPLVKVCRRANKEFYFHLFTDLLLYSEATVLGYRLHRAMELEMCAVEDVEDELAFDGTPPHGFNILSSSKSFMACAPTAENKKRWIDEMSAAIVAARAATGQRADVALARAAPVWIPDRASRTCRLCHESFTFSKRRHHCRMCGNIICDSCSKQRRLLRNIDEENKVRVCNACVSGSSRGVHNLFYLHVNVLAARNLPRPGKGSVNRSGSGSSGKSAGMDTFVRVFCEEQLRGQTQVRRGTVNPTWADATFPFHVRDLATSELRIEVWRHDQWSDNAFLGQLTIPLAAVAKHECDAAKPGAGSGERFYSLTSDAKAGLVLSTKLTPPASLEASDNPMTIVKAWESNVDENPCAVNAYAVLLLYKVALAICEAPAAGPKSEYVAQLKRNLRLFLARADVQELGLEDDDNPAAQPGSPTPASGGAGSSDGDVLSQRRRVLYELVAAERSYLRDLDALVTCYVNPLTDVSAGAKASKRRLSMAVKSAGISRRRSMIPSFGGSRKTASDKSVAAIVREANFAVLLNLVQQLRTLSSKFLDDISRMADKRGHVHVGSVVVEFGRLLKLFHQFATAFAVASDVLKAPELEDFLKDLSNNPMAGGRSLQELMERPLARLPQYAESFTLLRAQTPDKHPDAPLLDESVKLAVDAAASALQTQERKAMHLGLKQAASSLSGWPTVVLGRLVPEPAEFMEQTPLAKSRRFLRSGPLVVVSSDCSETRCQAILLNGGLILADPPVGGVAHFRRFVELSGAVLQPADETAVLIAHMYSAASSGGGAAGDRRSVRRWSTNPMAVDAPGAASAQAKMAAAVAHDLERPTTAHAAVVSGLPQHDLVEVSVREPKKCSLCKQFIWGMRKQGLQCSVCAMFVHRACSPAACVMPCDAPVTAPRPPVPEELTDAERGRIYTKRAFALTVPPAPAARAGSSPEWLCLVPDSMGDRTAWLAAFEQALASGGDGADEDGDASGTAVGGAGGADGSGSQGPPSPRSPVSTASATPGRSMEDAVESPPATRASRPSMASLPEGGVPASD